MCSDNVTIRVSPPVIVTEYVNPPIPFRGNDWVASVDGQEEGPHGYGHTEAEAVADLKSRLED